MKTTAKRYQLPAGYFETILETMAEAVLIVNTDGMLSYANTAALSRFDDMFHP